MSGAGQSVRATFNLNASTTTTVTSPSNPSVYGQSVTFNAKVGTSGSSTPTGSVQFVVDGSNFGSPVAVSSCAPSLSACATTAAISTLNVSGTPHSVTANYIATGGFNNSSGTLSGGGHTVSKATLTVTADNKSREYGD